VADVDGDGQLETIAGVRGTDPKTQGCAYVVGADGKVKSALKLGGGANASPAVGDIDGDGQLEVLIASEGPARIQALAWNAGGRVAWPSMRGNSRMTANGNLPQGGATAPGTESAPHALADLTSVGEMAIDPGDITWGENRWNVSWKEPAPDQSFLEVTVIYPGGPDETRIVDIKPGSTAARAPVYVAREARAF
jgi:hypothetical protein